MSNRGYKQKCTVCGKEYWARHTKARYCSDKCKMRHFRDKKQPGYVSDDTATSPWKSILEKID